LQPMAAPEVTFVGTPPVHTHIYSNGHICLSLLSDDWSPALTVSSLSVSILSMLSSATKKKAPADDASYVKRKRGSPKDT
jgi:ubiquitin-conjugating enzyme E2 W